MILANLLRKLQAGLHVLAYDWAGSKRTKNLMLTIVDIVPCGRS
jgi:hypothetical protein